MKAWRRWCVGAVIAFTGALPGCFLKALGECPPDNKYLSDGRSVDGIDPDKVIAPLIGDHVATLRDPLIHCFNFGPQPAVATRVERARGICFEGSMFSGA